MCQPGKPRPTASPTPFAAFLRVMRTSQRIVGSVFFFRPDQSLGPGLQASDIKATEVTVRWLLCSVEVRCRRWCGTCNFLLDLLDEADLLSDVIGRPYQTSGSLMLSAFRSAHKGIGVQRRWSRPSPGASRAGLHLVLAVAVGYEVPDISDVHL